MIFSGENPLMKKILPPDIIRLTEYLDTVVYYYLLIFPDLKSAPAQNLIHEKAICKQIVKYGNKLNETSSICRIGSDFIFIKQPTRKKTETFLSDCFAAIIKPESYDGDFPTAQMFYKRYVTKEAYGSEVLKLFTELAQKLINLKICWTQIDKIKSALPFYGTVADKKHKRAFKNIISDLINSKLKPSDNAADYFPPDNDIPEFTSYLKRYGFPSILETSDNKIIISPLYDDETHFMLLPYIVCLMRSSLIPMPLLCLLLYSLLK